MEALKTSLCQIPLFAHLPQEVLIQDILPRGIVQEYGRDQLLIAPGQVLERFGAIIRGKVQILHLFADGSHSLMSVRSSGELLGLDLACTPSRISPYHARAASAVQIVWLPAELLTGPGLLSEADRLKCTEQALMLIARENMKKEYRLAILSRNGLRARISTYLAMQARKRRSLSFAIPFSREELASFLCVNRSALSHELSRMQQEGLIRFRKNAFTLLQPELFWNDAL